MKKLFIGLFVLLGLFTLAACGTEEKPAPGLEDFEQNTEEFVPNINMYIIGSHFNSWGADTIHEADPSCTFVVDENSEGLNKKYTYKAVVTQEMLDGNEGKVECKFIGQNSWTGAQFGVEDIDFEKSNDAFKTMFGKEKTEFNGGTTNRSNIVITQPGEYLFEYYPYNFTSVEIEGCPYTCKFVVTFTPAA